MKETNTGRKNSNSSVATISHKLVVLNFHCQREFLQTFDLLVPPGLDVAPVCLCT